LRFLISSDLRLLSLMFLLRESYPSSRDRPNYPCFCRVHWFPLRTARMKAVFYLFHVECEASFPPYLISSFSSPFPSYVFRMVFLISFWGAGEWRPFPSANLPALCGLVNCSFPESFFRLLDSLFFGRVFLQTPVVRRVTFASFLSLFSQLVLVLFSPLVAFFFSLFFFSEG